MNYLAAINDFFKSPKWMMNLLLAGICCIIPIVGGMVLVGWFITGFWCRSDRRFETFPDFDFAKFGKNLERGVWPVLVWIAVAIVIAVLGGVVSFVILLASPHHTYGFSIVHLFLSLILAAFWVALFSAAGMLYAPVYLRAARMQDLMPAFDFGYAKKFLSVMWKDCLGAAAALFVAIFAVQFVAMLPCVGCITVLLTPFCAVLWGFMHFHLVNQLYDLYVSRGGEPIPLSPKLTEEPPSPLAPPPAAPLPPV